MLRDLKSFAMVWCGSRYRARVVELHVDRLFTPLFGETQTLV